jgi:hypothetical protein
VIAEAGGGLEFAISYSIRIPYSMTIIRRALISVSDKSGVLEFARAQNE